jgi:hypothetical protein
MAGNAERREPETHEAFAEAILAALEDLLSSSKGCPI